MKHNNKTSMDDYIKEVRLNSLDNVKIIEIKFIPDETGNIRVLERGNSLPMTIERLFIVSDLKGTKRGFHAHKECAQLLICLNGTCKVVCDDGENKKTFFLKNNHQSLYLPPTIWAEQHYIEDNTKLLVLCDFVYDENDYIRDYAAFLDYRKTKKIGPR